jgi:putative transposase
MHVGHLFQDRFKSLLVDKDVYLLACGAYIELNPVRAHIVDTPELYPFSSFTFYAQGKTNDLLDPSPVYLALSDSPQMRQQLFVQFVKDQLLQPTYDDRLFNQTKALGNSSFLQSIQLKTAVPLTNRPRGRPKKTSCHTRKIEPVPFICFIG